MSDGSLLVAPTRPTVVLLHGLARRSGSLGGMRRFLERAGFPTWAITYASRRRAIEEAAREVTDKILTDLPDRPLCAVTHSLGGILIRHMHDPRLHWQHIVMLAPPNQGSQVALALRENPLFRWFYGEAGQQLGAEPRWPMPPARFAVIAGTRGDSLSNPARWLPQRPFAEGVLHDGTVAVEETRLDGMAAFATVDATHTWIMNHSLVRAYTRVFLEGGTFPT